MLWNDAKPGGFAYGINASFNEGHLKIRLINTKISADSCIRPGICSKSLETLEKSNFLRGRSIVHTARLCCPDNYCGICQRIFKAILQLQNHFTTLLLVLEARSQKLYGWGCMWSKTVNKTFIYYIKTIQFNGCDVPSLRSQVWLTVIHHFFDHSIHALNC